MRDDGEPQRGVSYFRKWTLNISSSHHWNSFVKNYRINGLGRTYGLARNFNHQSSLIWSFLSLSFSKKVTKEIAAIKMDWLMHLRPRKHGQAWRQSATTPAPLIAAGPHTLTEKGQLLVFERGKNAKASVSPSLRRVSLQFYQYDNKNENFSCLCLRHFSRLKQVPPTARWPAQISGEAWWRNCVKPVYASVDGGASANPL